MLVNAAARHCACGPPVSLSPPSLFGRPRAHRARHPHPPVSGRCRQGPPLPVPRFLHVSATLPDPHRRPLRCVPAAPLLKRAPHRRPNSLSPAPRFSPLRSDAAPPPPPSPPPQATGPPCRSPEPSHPCHRPQPLRRRRRSDPSRRAAARVSPAPFPLADAFAVE
jgi:hypothetical protein